MSRNWRYRFVKYPSDEEMSRNLNGAPEPTRTDLRDGYFVLGASSKSLKRLLDRKWEDISRPADADDLYRCVVLLQRYSKGDSDELKEILDTLRKEDLGLYWDALFDNWDYLVKNMLYSDDISTKVISCMIQLVSGYTSNDYIFLERKEMNPEIVKVILEAMDQLETWKLAPEHLTKQKLIRERILTNDNPSNKFINLT